MCVSGSRMIQGVDFTSSYSPTVDADSFRLSVNVAASQKMIIVLYMHPMLSDKCDIRPKTEDIRHTSHNVSRMVLGSKSLIMSSLRNIQKDKRCNV